MNMIIICHHHVSHMDMYADCMPTRLGPSQINQVSGLPFHLGPQPEIAILPASCILNHFNPPPKKNQTGQFAHW